ncbi:hypothetical protein D3C75_1089410 [compost metagenome]
MALHQILVVGGDIVLEQVLIAVKQSEGTAEHHIRIRIVLFRLNPLDQLTAARRNQLNGYPGLLFEQRNNGIDHRFAVRGVDDQLA